MKYAYDDWDRSQLSMVVLFISNWGKQSLIFLCNWAIPHAISELKVPLTCQYEGHSLYNQSNLFVISPQCFYLILLLLRPMYFVQRCLRAKGPF